MLSLVVAGTRSTCTHIALNPLPMIPDVCETGCWWFGSKSKRNIGQLENHLGLPLAQSKSG